MAYTIDQLAQAAAELTDNDTAGLIGLLVQQREEKQMQEAQNEASKREQLTAAIATLTALLGNPDGTAPDESTIYGLLRHDNATLQENAGLAIRLVLEGLATTVRTTRDLATVVGS